MNSSEERRSHERTPYSAPLQFTVLAMHMSELRKTRARGEIVDVSTPGLGIVTDFPLEPGHVLEWDDIHQRGKLHIALVKWSQKKGDAFRAGLMFI